MKTKTRSARKARNVQRFADRARALNEAGRARRVAVDAAYATLDAEAALDAVLVRCDGCGLEQVAPGPIASWLDEFDQRYECVVCGSLTGTFAAYLPGHAIGSPP